MADSSPSGDSMSADSMSADYPQIRAAVRGISGAGGALGGVKSVGAGYVVDGLWASALGKASLDADISLSDYAVLLSTRLKACASAAQSTVDELVLTDTEFATLLRKTLPE